MQILKKSNNFLQKSHKLFTKVSVNKKKKTNILHFYNFPTKNGIKKSTHFPQKLFP